MHENVYIWRENRANSVQVIKQPNTMATINYYLDNRDTQMDKILEVIGKQTEQQSMLIEHLINKH